LEAFYRVSYFFAENGKFTKTQIKFGARNVVLHERRNVFLSDISRVTWCLYFFR